MNCGKFFMVLPVTQARAKASGLFYGSRPAKIQHGVQHFFCSSFQKPSKCGTEVLSRWYAKHRYGVFSSQFAQRALPSRRLWWRADQARSCINTAFVLIAFVMPIKRLECPQTASSFGKQISHSLVIWLAAVLLVLPLILIIFVDVECVCLGDDQWPPLTLRRLLPAE